MNIASFIDHTILKPTTILHEVDTICEEAMFYNFAAVCIPPYYVRHASIALHSSKAKVATVIGFPFGYTYIETKTSETRQAIENGATEIDMVINIAALKNGNYNYLKKEVLAILNVARNHGTVLKVIIESGILTQEEIIKSCELYGNQEVDFVKTSTGYAEKGATIEAVQLMRQHLPSGIGIKASGGIKTFDFAQQLIIAGATRLGCSASVAIVKGAEENGDSNY
jgi:deoxyribose-phosphate aldolase